MEISRYEDMLNEPDMTAIKFIGLVNLVRSSDMKDGIRIDLTEQGCYLLVFPEGIYAVNGRSPRNLTLTDAVEVIYDDYFASGGLESVMEAVQALGVTREYTMGSRVLTVSPGVRSARFDLRNTGGGLS